MRRSFDDYLVLCFPAGKSLAPLGLVLALAERDITALQKRLFVDLDEVKHTTTEGVTAHAAWLPSPRLPFWWLEPGPQ